MKLITTRGEFGSLQLLRAAYLNSDDGGRYWLDPNPFGQEKWPGSVLHASDTGGCPRAAMYRLLGTPEKPRSAKSKANRTIMFWAGYRFHFLTYSALNWAGILVGHEIPAAPKEDWEGSMDAAIRPNIELDEVVNFDEKTVLPNMLQHHRKDTPKAKDCTQLGTYTITHPAQNGLIEYTDRAGSNDPEECSFELAPWVEVAKQKMAYLEACRERLPELPPTLEQIYVRHDTEAGDFDSVTLETPWDCGYCDYHLTAKESRINPNSGRMKQYSWTQKESTCKPVNLPPLQVAKVDGKSWSFRDKSEGLDRFLASLTGVPIVGGDE